MAITIQIYDSTDNKTQSVSVDFATDIMNYSYGSANPEPQFFFKFTTGARDTDGSGYSLRIITTLTDLALNRTKRSSADSAVAYENIKIMVTDEIFDFIYGHTADQYSSGCTAKAPMNI